MELKGKVATAEDVAGVKIVNSKNVTTAEVMTVNTIILDGIEFKPKWETEGLKIPIVIPQDDGNKCVVYIRIPREEIKNMITDLLSSLSFLFH